MTLSRGRWTVCAALVGSQLPGCATEPGDRIDSGQYVLVSVNNQSLPVILWDTTYAVPGALGETGARNYMFADTLRFDTPGALSRHDGRAFVLVFPARRDSSVQSGGQSAAHTVSGNQVVHGINLGEHQLGTDTLFLEADGRLRDDARISFICGPGPGCVQRAFQFRYQRTNAP